MATALVTVLAVWASVAAGAEPLKEAAPRGPLAMKGPQTAENLMTGETTEDPLRKPLRVAPGDVLTISLGRQGGLWTYVYRGDEPRPLELSARPGERRRELLVHRPGGEELVGLKTYDAKLRQPQFEQLCRAYPNVLSFAMPNSAREVTDLTPLRHMPRLTALKFSYLPQVPDLVPLAGLKDLVSVEISSGVKRQLLLGVSDN